MILLKTKEVPAPLDHPIGIMKGFRWILEISRWSIELNHQCRTDNGDWYRGGGYYAVSITGHWALGREHMYYDGPHDSFSLGYLHIVWQGDWCEKCAERV